MSRKLIAGLVAILSLVSFWAVATFVPPLLGDAGPLLFACVWAILLGVILHMVHGTSRKHRGVDGGVKFLFILLLALCTYEIVWHLYVYLAAAFPVLPWSVLPVPDLLHYPILWINRGVGWLVTLLAGTGSGGLLHSFQNYAARFLPITAVCGASYWASHSVTVCFRR